MPHFQQNWLEHQVRDEYWKHGSVCEDYSAIKIPVLAIDGWEDSYKNTPLSLMEGLGEDVPKKAILGPWGHVYPHNGIPVPAMGFLQEGVKWWDRWLKDEDNDVMDGPMVDLWMQESIEPDSKYPVSKGRWVGVDSWPSNDVKEKSLELTSSILLEENTKDEERVLLNTPLNHGLLAGEWMGAGVLGESPADQRLDNGLAMTFDSDLLDEDFEILGYPTVDIKLSSDKEHAMLYASIMDVAPDGSARRVSYGVMNLTHLEGHDRVVLLEPGKDVNVRVRLDAIAYNFTKGHKIRLALATSAWPMFWTMPEDATLNLDLKNAKLKLPLFSGKDSEGPNMEPQSAPETPITILKEGRVDRTIEYDIVDDIWTCRTDGVGGVFGEGVYRFDDIDVTVEHNLSNKLVLSNKDPLSAEYTIVQEMIIGREGWLIDADIFTRQISDLDYFYLETEIKIKENGEHVFAKKWHEKVKRNGL